MLYKSRLSCLKLIRIDQWLIIAIMVIGHVLFCHAIAGAFRPRHALTPPDRMPTNPEQELFNDPNQYTALFCFYYRYEHKPYIHCILANWTQHAAPRYTEAEQQFLNLKAAGFPDSEILNALNRSLRPRYRNFNSPGPQKGDLNFDGRVDYGDWALWTRYEDPNRLAEFQPMRLPDPNAADQIPIDPNSMAELEFLLRSAGISLEGILQ